MFTDIYTTKDQIEQVVLESGELLKEHIYVQTVDIIAKKNALVKSQVEEITNRFQVLEKSIQETHTT
jgi:hypothetical protein